MNDISPFRYVPMFSGKSQDDEKVVLYRSVDHPREFHLRVDDGELRALSPGSEVESWFEVGDEAFHISIVSPEWIGKATGTKRDAIEEEAIRR